MTNIIEIYDEIINIHIRITFTMPCPITCDFWKVTKLTKFAITVFNEKEACKCPSGF